MEKSRIFIASSGRTLVLAEKLRDELQTEYCEATLWTEEGKDQTSATIIEILEKATAKYDFAVIVLAKDDVLVREAGDTLKARDNCVFEAGLFMSAIGRERCFLVNSVEQRNLPSDLGGIISIPFKEPANLADRDACARAIGSVSAVLKDSVQRAGRSVFHERLPLLSIDEVFQRERPHSDGGDLCEGQVVVCDLQPMAGPERAVQVRRNLDSGTSYHYFLYHSEDAIEKTCQSLQVVLMGGNGGTEKATDFNTRLNTISKERDHVLDNLRRICRTRSLVVSTFPYGTPVLLSHSQRERSRTSPAVPEIPRERVHTVGRGGQCRVRLAWAPKIYSRRRARTYLRSDEAPRPCGRRETTVPHLPRSGAQQVFPWNPG